MSIRVGVDQVDSLRPGDVVRFRNVNWPEGAAVTGLAYREANGTTQDRLFVAGQPIRTMAACGTLAEFEIVSRAPRLYANHDRAEPVPGDVVRDADDESDIGAYFRAAGSWYDRRGYGTVRSELPRHLLLLVDGETGRAVPQ